MWFSHTSCFKEINNFYLKSYTISCKAAATRHPIHAIWFHMLSFLLSYFSQSVSFFSFIHLFRSCPSWMLWLCWHVNIMWNVYACGKSRPESFILFTLRQKEKQWIVFWELSYWIHTNAERYNKKRRRQNFLSQANRISNLDFHSLLPSNKSQLLLPLNRSRIT